MNLLKTTPLGRFAVATIVAICCQNGANAAPGDDYVQSCTSPTPQTQDYYSGYASCFAYVPGSFLGVTLGQYVAPQLSPYIYLSSGVTNCLALVPFSYKGTTTAAPVCSPAVPKQPFTNLTFNDGGCYGGKHIGDLYWSPIPGATYEVQEARVLNAPNSAFKPFTLAEIGIPGKTGGYTYRMRATLNGQTGSWTYTSIRAYCQGQPNS